MSALTLLVVSVCAVPCFGQDSISNTGGGFYGDCVSPYATNEQLNTYVVDLTSFTTSWGNKFGIAPIVKPGKGTTAYFNNGMSAQYISADMHKNVPYPFQTYYYWNSPGAGINDDPNRNDPGVPINKSGISNQFGVMFSEWCNTDNGASGNYITTGMVNYNTRNPSRLYVSRIQTAINGQNDVWNYVQFGAGAVDADGNTYIRGDDSGVMPGGVTGNNIFRVNALSRDFGALNYIDAAGPSDCGDWLVAGSSTTFSTPCCVPGSLANHPVYIGANFNSELAYESSPMTVSYTTAHLSGSADHRGNVAFSKAIAFPNASPTTVGTGSVYGKDALGDTRRVLLWGVTGNGDVSGTHYLEPPTTITDNHDLTVFPYNDVIGSFTYYKSQVSYRGGNGPVAVGTDRYGNVLVAFVVVVSEYPGGYNNPFNAVAVARFDPDDPDGTLEWTLAGYVDDYDPNPVYGKEIYGYPGGNIIGRMAALFEVTGGSPVGPSISSPVIDSVGNIWFLASVELFKGPYSDFDTVLLRAVYNPNTFSYKLELVLEVGDEFFGQNSQRNYRVNFLGMADSNSIDSGTMWSGNIMQCGWNGRTPPKAMKTRNPQTLGGLIFRASILYDVDDNGEFTTEYPPDEYYTALMYIGWPGNGVTVPQGPEGESTGQNAEKRAKPPGGTKQVDGDV